MNISSTCSSGRSGEEVGVRYGQQAVVPILDKKLDAILFGAVVDADGLVETADADIELALGVRPFARRTAQTRQGSS